MAVIDGLPDAPSTFNTMPDEPLRPAVGGLGEDHAASPARSRCRRSGVDGAWLAADGQLAGTPSVIFDAVAVILSDEGAKAMSTESAAIDFVRDAFGHLKRSPLTKATRPFDSSEYRTRCGCRGCQRPRRIYCRSKDPSRGAGKSIRTLA